MNSELKELQKKKLQLQNEMYSLDDKEKKLQDKAKTLEALAIQGLGGTIETKRETVNQLEAKLKELEKKIATTEVQELPETLQNITTVEAQSEGPKLNRVNLKKNVVFSWSYQKLP